MAYGPIQFAQNLGLTQPLAADPEAASQTFKPGTPLRVVSGYIAAADSTWAAADIIVGFSQGAGKNLTSSGVTEDGYSIGSPIGQSSAKIIPTGAPVLRGNCLYTRCDGNTIFRASLKSGQTFSQALLIPGTLYSLQKDATTGYWFIDSTDTAGNDAVAEITGVDPSDSTFVYFKIGASRRPA